MHLKKLTRPRCLFTDVPAAVKFVGALIPHIQLTLWMYVLKCSTQLSMRQKPGLNMQADCSNTLENVGDSAA